MLKQIVTLESIVEGKVGQFLLAHDTDVKIAKEMCLQFLKYLGNIEDQAAQAQAQAAQKPPEQQASNPPEEVKNV
jgi:hypothetical protein